MAPQILQKREKHRLPTFVVNSVQFLFRCGVISTSLLTLACSVAMFVWVVWQSCNSRRSVAWQWQTWTARVEQRINFLNYASTTFLLNQTAIKEWEWNDEKPACSQQCLRSILRQCTQDGNTPTSFHQSNCKRSIGLLLVLDVVVAMLWRPVVASCLSGKVTSEKRGEAEREREVTCSYLG